jgi:5-methylcytosine-specific restriction enzyme A
MIVECDTAAWQFGKEQIRRFSDARELPPSELDRSMPCVLTAAGYRSRFGGFTLRAEDVQDRPSRFSVRLTVFQGNKCLYGRDDFPLGSSLRRASLARELSQVAPDEDWDRRIREFAVQVFLRHRAGPPVQSLGVPPKVDPNRVRTNSLGRLLCSQPGCDDFAAWVTLIPWCIDTQTVKATCQAHTVDEGYAIDVQQLAARWDGVLAHLAEKRGGGGTVQLLRWLEGRDPSRLARRHAPHRSSYMAWKWRRRRVQASAALRKAVLERDAYRCQDCRGWIDLELDHIIPVEEGGKTTLENLRTLCRICHDRRHTPDPSEP